MPIPYDIENRFKCEQEEIEKELVEHKLFRTWGIFGEFIRLPSSIINSLPSYEFVVNEVKVINTIESEYIIVKQVPKYYIPFLEDPIELPLQEKVTYYYVDAVTLEGYCRGILNKEFHYSITLAIYSTKELLNLKIHLLSMESILKEVYFNTLNRLIQYDPYNKAIVKDLVQVLDKKFQKRMPYDIQE